MRGCDPGVIDGGRTDVVDRVIEPTESVTCGFSDRERRDNVPLADFSAKRDTDAETHLREHGLWRGNGLRLQAGRTRQ